MDPKYKDVQDLFDEDIDEDDEFFYRDYLPEDFEDNYIYPSHESDWDPDYGSD